MEQSNLVFKTSGDYRIHFNRSVTYILHRHAISRSSTHNHAIIYDV